MTDPRVIGKRPSKSFSFAQTLLFPEKKQRPPINLKNFISTLIRVIRFTYCTSTTGTRWISFDSLTHFIDYSC